MYFNPEDFFGQKAAPQRPQANTSLYESLNVSKTATEAEIRSEYKRLVKLHHPDHGGDAEKFKEIHNAYQVLRDPKTRRIYDTTGEQKQRVVPRKKKLPPVIHELPVPLDQFFTGKVRHIRVQRDIVCNECQGKGGHGFIKCTDCSGQGIQIVERRLGPNIIQRKQQRCSPCKGKGEIAPNNLTCTDCKGRGLKRSPKLFAVEILRGMEQDEKIVFANEGDQRPGFLAGDFVVVLKQQAHPEFKRSPDGCHLHITKQLTLLEALTGFQLSISHLDGRTLLVSSEPGVVYKQGDMKAIREEGFPLRSSGVNGHLYISLDVIMPTSLDQQATALLSQALGPKRVRPAVASALDKKNLTPDSRSAVDDECTPGVQSVALEHVDVEVENRNYAQLRQAEQATQSQYESDPEEDLEESQPSCRTM